MGLLIFAYRKQDLMRRKSDIEFKILRLSKKLQDLTSYSSSIADGVVSTNDLMNAPGSLFNRMTSFMMYSHQAAYTGAQQQSTLMAQQGAFQNPQLQQNPQMLQQYQEMMFNSLYKQQRDKFAETETKLLNQQEKKISSEQEKLQTQLKMMEKEIESVTAAEDNAIKSSAPKFGLSG